MASLEKFSYEIAAAMSWRQKAKRSEARGVCSISPLFSTGQDRVVETQTRSSQRLLCRHPDMERAVISCVERGLADPGWRGRLYRFQATDDRLSKPEELSAAVSIERASGRFDGEITFRCRRCGARKCFPADVESAVKTILKDAGLDGSASPVLELPDEACDDEPGLNFDCPECHHPHRSTPFYVDRERSQFNANSDTSR